MTEGSPPPPPPIDWPAFIAELQGLAESSLGNRADKITDVLAAADASESGIAAAIDQITRMRVAFVDPVRLADLAYELKARLATRTGRPPPAARATDSCAWALW